MRGLHQRTGSISPREGEGEVNRHLWYTHRTLSVRQRYRAALTLIRATDQHRLLARVGRNTRVDDWDVMEAHETYRRCG